MCIRVRDIYFNLIDYSDKTSLITNQTVQKITTTIVPKPPKKRVNKYIINTIRATKPNTVKVTRKLLNNFFTDHLFLTN